MAMAGWKTGDMLNGIEGIMNLAAASGEDLATTSDIVTDALTAFGLSASDSTHFADVLAKASSNANTNVGLMGETFKYVAPLAGALGFSAEDCATAIGLMANSGIKSSQAGTNLRAILSRMAKPTDEVQAAMDKLGLSLTDSSGNMKSLQEIMVDMRAGFAGLTEEQKANMAASLGGQDAMSGLLAIVNASDEDFASLTASIYDCDGAAAQMAETMNDNLEGQITILKSGLEGLGISLYEEMEKPCKDIVKEAQRMVQELQEAFNDGGLDGLVTKTGEVMAQIVTEVAKAAPKMISAAQDLVESFIDAIMRRKWTLATSGATMVSELAQAIMNLSGDMWSAGIYLFTNFLQAMVWHSSDLGRSFGEMLKKIGDTVSENLPTIIRAAKDFVAGFCDGLSEEFPNAAALMDGFFSTIFDKVETTVGKAKEVLKKFLDVFNEQDPETLRKLGELIGDIVLAIAGLKTAKTAASAITGLFSAFQTLQSGISGLVGGIGKIAGGISDFGSKIQSLSSVAGSVLSQVTSFIGSAVSAVANFFATFGATIAGVGALIGGAILAVKNFADMFQNGFDVVKEILMGVGIAIAAVGAIVLGIPGTIAAVIAAIVFAVANLAVAIKNHGDDILNAGKAVIQWFSELPGKAEDLFSRIITSVQNWASDMAEKASTAAKNTIDSVSNWFAELPGKISTWLQNALQNLVDWGTNIYNKASEAAKNAVESVSNFFSELPYKIGYALGYVIGKLIQFGIDAVNWAKTNVPIIIENVVTFFSELPGKIWTHLTTAFNNLVTWGANMLNKARESAYNAVMAIVDFYAQLPGKIYTWLQNALQNLTTWGANMWNQAKNAASNTINSVVDYFSQLPGRIDTWLENSISRIASWGSEMVNKARTAASNTINTVVNFFSQLPGKIWNHLTATVNRVASWGGNLAAKGRDAASMLVNSVINGASSLPSQMASVGRNIVVGVWNGICNAAGWFRSQVQSFFRGIVDGAKGALGIHSPSRVFRDEVGKWIPPGVGEGMDAAMPALEKQTDEEMAALARRMQATVNVETGKITFDKNTNQVYKIEQENGQAFDDSKTEVVISGETHVHVDLDGKEIGDATTPIVDQNMGRIDTHKKRGG